jgi:RES domain-containing protein
LLEILVHAEIDVEDIPVSFRYLEIEAPDSISIDTVNVEDLPGNWRSTPEATRRTGDEWLHSGRAALLRVPSVIVPMTWNVLVNPRHPESTQIRVIHVYEHGIDPRLL